MNGSFTTHPLESPSVTWDSETASLTMILVFFVACFAWTAYTLARTYRNYRLVWEACPEVPILLSVVYLGEPLWHCLQYFRPATYNDRVSIFFQLHRFQKYAWNFSDKYGLHAKYGKSFYLITPTQCEFITADGPVAGEILSRSFAKPVGLMSKGPSLAHIPVRKFTKTDRIEKLDMFGKSLASVSFPPRPDYFAQTGHQSWLTSSSAGGRDGLEASPKDHSRCIQRPDR